jgi:hypothetical protein
LVVQEVALRFIPSVAACIAVLLVGMSFPASSETRENYLSRLRAICEGGCLQPRELLRTARQRRPSATGEMAGIIDIAYVSQRNDKFLLHEQEPNPLDMSELDFGMPQLEQSPQVNVNRIVVELDEQTVRDLLGTPSAVVAPGRGETEDGEIIVEGDRDSKVVRPSLEALENMFRNRRIVVRGSPRLDVGFVGARRDRRRKMLTIIPSNADDLILLPRYGDDGEAILDGPLEGLRALRD